MDENKSPVPGRTGTFAERLRLVAAAIFGVVFGVSCLSFSYETKTKDNTSSDSSVTKRQVGESILADPPQTTTIYYPQPYLTPPNLRIDPDSHEHWGVAQSWEMVEQKADHFTIRLTNARIFGKTITWTAEGIPAPLPVAPSQIVVPVTVPATATNVPPDPPMPIVPSNPPTPLQPAKE